MRVQYLLVAALLGAAAPACAQPAPPATSDPASRAWLGQQFRQYESGLLNPPVGAPSAAARSLATWDWLRRTPPVGQEPPLAVMGEFVKAHLDWPGVTAIRRRAEARAADPRTPDGEALALFRTLAPEGAAAQARFATLLPGDEGLAMARRAWPRTGIDPMVEEQLWQRFGARFTPAENWQRADTLIWAGQTTAAARMLPRLAPSERALATARIAYRTGSPDAEALGNAVPAALAAHPGLANDRALWLERRGRLGEAEALLARGGTTPGLVAAPETWLERRLALGRAAMRRGDYQLAQRLLANHHALAPGANPATLPLSQRIDLSDTEWLAGWIALRRLNQPDVAQRHFERFNAAVTTPISRSRGDYWLGRAHKAAGRQAEAHVAFERAAQHFDYFYGQLAAEELGRTPQLPQVAPARPTKEDEARWAQSSLRQAVELLNDMGSRERESIFIRALADTAETPGLARLAADMGARIGRQDLGVWTWKAARPRGDMNSFDQAFPRLPATAPVPPRDWIISHAIARQESSFDRTALSSAGARGLMQLMPATAQDVAAKLGLPYDRERLFSDPAYNLTLGSWYIGRRRDDFGSRMLAIAAYNAGAGNVRKWLAANGDPRTTEDPIDWIEMIPFQETRTYVQRVTENAVVYSLLEPGRQGANPRASAWLRGS